MRPVLLPRPSLVARLTRIVVAIALPFSLVACSPAADGDEASASTDEALTTPGPIHLPPALEPCGVPGNPGSACCSVGAQCTAPAGTHAYCETADANANQYGACVACGARGQIPCGGKLGFECYGSDGAGNGVLAVHGVCQSCTAAPIVSLHAGRRSDPTVVDVTFGNPGDVVAIITITNEWFPYDVQSVGNLAPPNTLVGSATFSGLRPGGKYLVTVRPYTPAGSSAPCATTSAVVDACGSEGLGCCPGSSCLAGNFCWDQGWGTGLLCYPCGQEGLHCCPGRSDDGCGSGPLFCNDGMCGYRDGTWFY